MAARRTKATGSAVATVEPAGLPDLVPTGREDFDVDARDITPPRLKAASPISDAASSGDVPLFALYSTKGQDDTAPVVMVPPTKGPKYDVDKDGEDFGLKVYVLRMYTTLGASVNPLNWQEEQRNGGELRVWSKDDPSAPPFARRQYNYVLYVPESQDADLPHNLLLRGMRGSQVARRLNTLLMQRNEQGQPLHTAAFRLWAAKAERTDNGQVQRWAFPDLRQVEADPDDVRAATVMLGQITSARQSRGFENRDASLDQRVSETEPAI